jgi:hypothetical protein
VEKWLTQRTGAKNFISRSDSELLIAQIPGTLMLVVAAAECITHARKFSKSAKEHLLCTHLWQPAED